MTRAKDISKIVTDADLSGTLDVAGNLSVDGGTIKLDGNYPVGTQNVALGDTAFDSAEAGAYYNVAIGDQALTANTTGNSNVGIGRRSTYSNTTGTNNVGIGTASLASNSTGQSNTAVGSDALLSNTTASDNTAVGYAALYDNTTGIRNTAVGSNALENNTEGTRNTSVGKFSSSNVTTGSYNTAMGHVSLGLTTTGSYNVALGEGSLYSNTTASNNTAVGYQASYSQTVAGYNTSVGYQAGYSYASGAGNGFNTMIGLQSGYSNTGYQNTFVGHQSGYFVTSGAKNVILGGYSGNQDGLDIRTSNNNIVLSDGDGRALGYYTSSGAFWKFRGNANGYFATSISQENTGGSPYGVQIQYNNTAPDNQNGQFIRCQDSSSTRFIVYNDGDVVNHDNSYGSISDIKLKEQITNASSQWDDIKAIQVRKYKMKEDVSVKGDSDEHWRLGVVAQELETAGMNGLVQENIDRDDEMNDLGTTTKTVKYSILYMKAVKALQEAMTRIETLEAKVTALENG